MSVFEPIRRRADFHTVNYVGRLINFESEIKAKYLALLLVQFNRESVQNCYGTLDRPLRKDLRHKSLPPKNLRSFMPCNTGFPYLVYPNSAFFRRKGAIGGGGETTQEHLFKSHRSAREVWIDSDILENFSRNGSYVIVARSRSFPNCKWS